MGFRNIEKQALTAGKVVPLTLNQLVGDPVLHVAHLGETNAEFWNDAIARAQQKATASGSTFRVSITPKAVKEARAKNREIVAKYAVKGLEGFAHDDGRPADLTDIPAIIDALPDEVFDSVLAFCQNSENFRDRTLGNPVEIAGK